MISSETHCPYLSLSLTIATHYISTIIVDESVDQPTLSKRKPLHYTTKLRFPQEICTYPLYINITFQLCPLGFTLSQSLCDYSELLRHVPTVDFDIQSKTISRAGTVWVGIYKNETTAVLEYCPLGHSKNQSVQLDLNNQNSNGRGAS
jgi:hypothetical protein